MSLDQNANAQNHENFNGRCSKPLTFEMFCYGTNLIGTEVESVMTVAPFGSTY